MKNINFSFIHLTTNLSLIAQTVFDDISIYM